MSKIKEAKRNLRHQRCKTKLLKILKKKEGRCKNNTLNSFILFFVSMLLLPLSLIINFLFSVNLEWFMKVSLFVCFISFSTWIISEIITFFLMEKIERKRDLINKTYPDKKIYSGIKSEELPLYLEELNNMSDKEVNRIPSIIINQVISKKQELEIKEVEKEENTDKLSLIKTRNKNPLIENT